MDLNAKKRISAGAEMRRFKDLSDLTVAELVAVVVVAPTSAAGTNRTAARGLALAATGPTTAGCRKAVTRKRPNNVFERKLFDFFHD